MLARKTKFEAIDITDFLSRAHPGDDCLQASEPRVSMFLGGTKTIATSVAICYRQPIPPKGDNLPC